MTTKDFLTILKNKWEIITIATIVGATIGLYINFFLPHYFRASSEFLIVQKQNTTLDAYTAIKGSEQLAYTLKQIIYSPAFIDQVMKSNFDINLSYFGENPEKIIKKWNKTISIRTLPNTGILKIKIFHPNRAESQKISQAVGMIISKDYEHFLGENHQINIIPLSNTIVSNKFVRPNALANTILGFVLGLTAGVTFAVFPQMQKISNRSVKKIKLKNKTIRKKQNPRTRPSFRKRTTVPSNLPIA